MSATDPTPDGADEPRVHTLCALLCAGDRTPRTTESVWLALVGSIAAGDQFALRDLYVRMHRIVFTLIVRIVQDRATAEELTLDVFHDVWRRASSYDEAAGTVVGWILNQARSRAIDQTRFERRKKRVNPYPDALPGASLVISSETLLDGQHRAQRLRAALVRLTAKESEVVELAFFSGCTYAEVADRLCEPLGTVKTRIRAALKKLRRELGPQVPGP